MTNLLDLVKNQIGSAAVSKMSSFLGTSDAETNSAVDAFIPAMLSGVIDNTNTEADASNLLGMINKHDLGSNVLDNLGDILGGGERTSSFLSTGSSLISSIFGNNEGGFMDKLSSLTSLGSGVVGKLAGLLAPIIMSVIGKFIKSSGLNAGGLLSFLNAQKANVHAGIPAGFAAMGAGSGADRVAATTERVSEVRDDNDGGGGMGWLKWLLPLLLLALLAWWFMRDKDGVDMDDDDDIENVEDADNLNNDNRVKQTHTHANGEVHEGPAHGTNNDNADANTNAKMTTANKMSYRIDKNGNIIDEYDFIVYTSADVKKDANGNIVDGNGRILIPVAKIPTLTIKTVGKKSPNLKVDKDGNLVDENGKILYKKGEFKEENGYYVDTEGNKIGFFKRIGRAIGDAAEATADAFKNIFTGLFSSEDKVGTSYKVSRMDFNKDNHRLTYFSKQEFEGLVAALNEYPNKKLEVRVYTDDGKNEKENEKLSDLRANVVRDMMATLMGTKKGNIDFKGMGSSDAGKAGRDEVEIFVAQ